MRAIPPSRLDAGIFLVSLSILLVELLLTRIFSVTMFYHLSFLAVSLAMMGLGTSGLLVTIFPRRFEAGRAAGQTAVAAIALAATTILAAFVAFWMPVTLEMTAGNWIRVEVIF